MSNIIKLQGRHPQRGSILSLSFMNIEDAWERLRVVIHDGYEAFITVNGERQEIH